MGFRIACVMLLAVAAFGQQSEQSWEAGVFLGYGWYRNARVNGPGAEATTGIRSRFTTGGVLTEDLYDHLSGEFRYVYHDGDPFLSIAGTKANIQGQSHTFTYDALFHVFDRDHRLRPFFATGIGAKYFRVTGPEPNPQPAPGVAALADASEWRLVVSVGGGVTYRLRNHVLLRADFRDYISPFPSRIIVPARGATARGILQQFTPMFGVGFWF